MSGRRFTCAGEKARWPRVLLFLATCAMLLIGTLFLQSGVVLAASTDTKQTAGTLHALFTRAAQESGVPEALLLAISYQESRLSDNNWHPSIDGGYGYLHLVKNERVNTLDKAAQLLKLPADALKRDAAANIRGGAAVLRSQAIELNGKLPTSLNDWYNTVALYSGSNSRSIAALYADKVYELLQKGFSVETKSGEVITVSPQQVQPNKQTFQAQVVSRMAQSPQLPAGCTNSHEGVEYPDAINCIIPPEIGDCARSSEHVICNYDSSSSRPDDYPIDRVVIHDIEGSAADALNIFLNPKVEYDVSIHYVVGSDGTVYQVLHERDTAYQAGNIWYNHHSIGIEHEGYADTGYLWYNATMYLASAKLSAYLADKYHIPIDTTHFVAHGATPSPAIGLSNHDDPGAYWMWRYYLNAIDKYSKARQTQLKLQPFTLTLFPESSLKMYGGSKPTPANFNYFYIYKEPDTNSPLIMDTQYAYQGNNNIDALKSYVFTDIKRDQGHNGYMMYKINFSVQPDPSKPAQFVQGWLAVPDGVKVEFGAFGRLVKLHSTDGNDVKIYGSPRTFSSSSYVIGNAPDGALFVSPEKIAEDGSGRIWYMINYNHRQAWVPVDELAEAYRY
ncbi:N-acetylmuramoyl-L-alanine amidase [Thermosporothrix hazakensis]|uniref:N-acetylmuramoyl-L-alanine amidase n=1 Tax=Thermosporothrix hazakensis TaxID=644383 RepID=A0A326U7J1_THEHA|nr:N-acetylmuramoyl-L-alanine amidase [Thermosporothrix hazakensis]PZW29492.1 N-acetylmuramoyl-L-alanine amidase [Thermosporothrix hazakensis]GCE45793.1 amidase [Thermosporothrix hazakensis]